MIRESLKTSLRAPHVPEAMPPVPPPRRTPTSCPHSNLVSAQAASGFCVLELMTMSSVIACVPTLPAIPGGISALRTSNFPPVLVGILLVDELACNKETRCAIMRSSNCCVNSWPGAATLCLLIRSDMKRMASLAGESPNCDFLPSSEYTSPPHDRAYMVTAWSVLVDESELSGR